MPAASKPMENPEMEFFYWLFYLVILLIISMQSINKTGSV